MAIELLDQILGHVRDAIHPRRIPILDWRMKEGEIAGAERSDFKEKGWADIRVPFDWGRPDRTVWFRSTMTIPEESAGKTLGLRLTFPEAQLYVNGEPHQGIDVNHTEVILTDKARKHQRFHFAVEAYSGRSGKRHQFSLADLVEVDLNARTLYYGLRLLQELSKVLDHNVPESAQIRELIRRTLIYLKYFAPDGEEYPNAISRALTFLQTSLGTEFQTTIPGLIHLVGQSHIDVAWLWKIAETTRKSGRTFSTALRLIDAYPEFGYSQSQAFLYDQTKRSFPSLFRSIKAQVTAGRWEPVGALWVEPDCNLPSGESLVRQVLHGTKFFREEFGTSSEVLWLPDTFGYAWSLPQIMKKSGLNYFFTTKLRWNDTTTFPHTSFWWQGIDGTRVLAHMPPLGLEAHLSPKDLRKTAKEFGDEEQPLPLMQTLGFGDGGGGPTIEQIETSRFLQSMPGLPPARLSRPTVFFKELETRSADLPVWNKELYLEKHRGTYTTHARIKADHRSAERALYVAEILTALQNVLPGAKPAPVPTRELDRAWKTLLTNQFHDILPGTAIKEAMVEASGDLATVRSTGEAIAAKALGGFISRAASKGGVPFTAFNPLATDRPAYVEVEVPGSDSAWVAVTADGSALTTQVLERTKDHVRLLVYLPSVPALGFRAFTMRPGTSPPSPEGIWKFAARTAESPRLRLRFDNKGGLSSIYDKTTRREFVQKGKRANAFVTFQDSPKEWEAWDIDSDLDRHRLELFTFKGSKVVESGPLRATLRQEYRTENGSVITQLIRLYHRSPRIDFATTVRWKEHHTLLKVVFPVGARVTNAVYEIPFGAIQRATRSREPEDKAKFEVPAQQWAAIGDGKLGGAVINDSKHGYDCRDNNLRLTLLRSPRYPHPVDPWHQTDPEYTDVGEHSFTYAFQPFVGDWRSANVVGEARSFNVPVVVTPGHPNKNFPSLFSISKSNIALSSVKQAEDGHGIVVRMYEATGTATDVTVQLGRKPASAIETDLLERPIKDLSFKGDRLPLRFKPFEIKTVQLVYVMKKK